MRDNQITPAERESLERREMAARLRARDREYARLGVQVTVRQVGETRVETRGRSNT